ncbi:zf-CCHC domain-containing protein [Tanacetum coccineum]
MDSYLGEMQWKKTKSRRRRITVSKKTATGEELDEESVKRQKLEDDAEKAELQLCLEIVPRDRWKMLSNQYERFVISEDESIDSAFARFNTIITSLKALDEGYSSNNYVRKFLKALHPRWKAKVTAIEESKDLTSLSLDELIENLKVHEMIIKKDYEIVKAKGERKPLALKAKKESSDEESSTSGSEDKEYVIAVRDFKKFFKRRGRCKDPNHLIGECPKPPREKNQKAFVGGSWSDSGEEYEKRLKTKHVSWFIHLARNSLKNKICELKEKLSKLERNKEVDLECTTCQTLKIDNEKLKEEALKLTQFQKSTHTLNEMLSLQKSSGDKSGLGFNSFEASTSGTKKTEFVKSQNETSSGGDPLIADAGPFSVQTAPKANQGLSVCSSENGKSVSFQKSILGHRPKHIMVNNVKIPVASDDEDKRIDLEPDKWIKDSGCSKHMTGNRKLFSTYKAYNGGNVVFGSNLRGQICDNNCKVIFSEHDREITKDRKVIGRGIRKSGLCVMKLGKKLKDKICLTIRADNRPPMLDKSRYNSWQSHMILYNKGLRPDVYSLVNHHIVAKDIRDRVKLVIEGSELSLQESESKLYDEFDTFTSEKGETPEWSKFVTDVKLAKDMHNTNFDHLYGSLFVLLWVSNVGVLLARRAMVVLEPSLVLETISRSSYVVYKVVLLCYNRIIDVLLEVPNLDTYQTNNVIDQETENKVVQDTISFAQQDAMIMSVIEEMSNQVAKDVVNVPVWVKLHGVPVTAFSEDGLSAIATKLGTPLMRDSYTSDMCIQSWGRSSYARSLIVVRADVELKDHIVNECPKNIDSDVVKNMKKHSQATRGVSVGPKVGFKPVKQVFRHVYKKNNVNTSGNKKKDVEPTIKIITKMANFLASKKARNGTISLAEKTRNETYENDYYDFDPYDDDMYEGHDIPDKIQAICDNLDINVRGRKKK